MDKAKIEQKIVDLESQMCDVDFWTDKNKAQAVLKEIAELKDGLAGVGKYDRGEAVMNILAGAGGDDAEDWVRILLEMYQKYFYHQGWSYRFLHQHQNTRGGYRNLTLEVSGHGVYGQIKNETGVHRLVRLSPFNADQKRHTSFALVEVLPKFNQNTEVEIRPEDLRVEFARSGGPGGQNVNKRETAVRVIHIPTNISAHSSEERSQAQNREKAMDLLKAKLFVLAEDKRKKEEKGMQVAPTTEIEWGNQIRNYVLHPYKLVKDTRTGVETGNAEKVLEGHLDDFIKAEKDL